MRQQDSSEGAADRTTVKPGFLSGRSIARHAKNSNGKDHPCSQNNPTMPLPNLLIVRHLNKDVSHIRDTAIHSLEFFKSNTLNIEESNAGATFVRLLVCPRWIANAWN
jgi:hypothetical protein